MVDLLSSGAIISQTRNTDLYFAGDVVILIELLDILRSALLLLRKRNRLALEFLESNEKSSISLAS